MSHCPKWTYQTREWIRAHIKHDPQSFDEDFHRRFRRNLVENWPLLDRHTWAPFSLRAAKAGFPLDVESSMWGPAGGLSALVLEDAYWWAQDRYTGASTTVRTRSLASEVRKIDDDLLSCARQMCALLERKTEISEVHGLSTEWSPDRLDLFALLCSVVEQMPNFQARVHLPFKQFIHAARQTSVNKPTFYDVLCLVREGVPGRVTANREADVASLGTAAGSASEGPGASVRRFFGMMDKHQFSIVPGSDVHPLDWLTNRGIACLLLVADGLDPTEVKYNEEQVKKLRQRYWRDRGRSDFG